MNEITALDLQACAAEPIRVPGGIQPHGAVLICSHDADVVLHVSANLESFTGLTLRPGDALASEPRLHELAADLARVGRSEPALQRTLQIADRAFQVAAHPTAQGLIVEFESPPTSEEATLEALYPRLRAFMETLAGAAGLQQIAEAAVREVRALTGFNRVLLYSFDAQGDGTVLAEDTDGVLPSYLNLRFPASDIPSQARELYKLSRIRLIPTASYRPEPLLPPISPIDGQPVDLGRAALRSVSPVHLEYMRNMGTASSMSISILVEGELWGLISGHSAEPKIVNPQVRYACDHLGQVLSLQVEARQQARRSAERLRLTHIQTDLLAKLATTEDYVQGLVSSPEAWMAVGGGLGAALVSGDEVLCVGLTPTEDQTRKLARRLFESRRAEVAVDSLAALWPDAERYAGAASGLLAVSVSQIHANYLMWFRPEVVRSVEWAGEPRKAVELGDRLHPRKSFQLWKEQVRLRALPWSDEEAESARRFRAAIQNFVLRRAEERAELTGRLAAINDELESFSYSISHDLRAPFRHVVGYADLLGERAGAQLDDTSRHYLASIRDAALTAGRLVDDLLAFSQMGRNGLRPSRVDVARLAADARRSLEAPGERRAVEWAVGDLPAAWGDPAMIRQVMQNLLDNALKYSAGSPAPRIEVSGEDLGDRTAYTVSDNGVGFDMSYAHKLFAVFQRLHRAEEFPGTGIGLALVRRIVERHGGDVFAKGEPGRGASFTFTLPKKSSAPVFEEP